MLRTNHAKDRTHRCGTLHWACRGEPAGSISYEAIMDEPGQERLVLSYTIHADDGAEQVRQVIKLCYTVPHYGGKRWWMICPYRHIRVGKLYLPRNGDRFACRHAWGLGYDIQRVSHRDRHWERLFALQRKLGCREGYENSPTRPKGMWRKTFEKHMADFVRLDAQCEAEFA